MANGLDAGDSIRGSDKFRFFRGWNTDQSAGERFVPMSDLVTYLNDPTVLSAVGGASDARVDNLEYNIGVNSLRDAVNGGYAYFNMVGGVGDVYTDETGVDTGAASNATYNAAGDYYAPDAASSADLLIQSETSDGSTTFTDTTGTHTITPNGDVQHDTDQAQFGSSSILFDGTGDYLSIPDSDDWSFGSGNFTIDMWIRPANVSGVKYLMGQWLASTNFSFLLYMNSTSVSFAYTTDGTTGTQTTLSFTAGLSATTWQHLAIVRDGADLECFVDGTSVGTQNISTDTIFAGTGGLTIGTDSGGASVYNGHMEEIRVLKGTAVWTANFTAPATPYILSTPNMTLPSIDFTTNLASVDYVRPVVLWEDITTGSTLNTDFILEVSRDSGTTWTAATLEQDAVFSGSAVIILVADEVDLTSQPAGTTATYRIRTANAKDIRVHGVYLQWR